jgi:hypothetical protein
MFTSEFMNDLDYHEAPNAGDNRRANNIGSGKSCMRGTLTRVRLIPLLDGALIFRRERTASAPSASQFHSTLNLTRRAKPFNLHRHSIARAATLFVNRFKSRDSGAASNVRINRAGRMFEKQPS